MKIFGNIGKQLSQYESSKIVLVSAPYDETSTWVKGSNKGPEAIIEASAYLELYDIETDSEVYKQGIHTDNPIISTGSIIEEIKNRISKHLKNNKFTVLLGGEHSVILEVDMTILLR